MKHIHSLIALLIAGGATMAAADYNVIVTDADGKTVTAPLTVKTTISFPEGGLTVTNGTDVKVIPWAQVESVHFDTPNAVESLRPEADALRLLTNPADTELRFAGALDAPATLAVTALSGMNMLLINNWNGETVDVSFLAPGLYFATVNNKTFKFIKK